MVKNEAQLLEKIVSKLTKVPYERWKSTIDETKEDALPTYSLNIENIDVKVSAEITSRKGHTSYFMQIYDDSVNSTNKYGGEKVDKLYHLLAAKWAATRSNEHQQGRLIALQRLLGYLENDGAVEGRK